MASSKEYLHFILEQLSDLDDISYRSMMGEYILYTKIYDTGRFSAVLPQVQVYLRDPLQRRENGRNCAGKGIRI